MREKKRYLRFSVETDAPSIEYYEVKGAVWNAVLSWMGEKGAAMARFRIIKNLWNPSKKEGVVSCSPKYVDDVRTALALIEHIGDASVIFRVTKVSGTIKSLFEDVK